MKVFKNIFKQIISVENLFAAWDFFKAGKLLKTDVACFEWGLEENIFALHHELRLKNYRYGPYFGFWIHDPKLRRIHKATVRDRVLHHAIFRILNPIFEPTFIGDSFSCRVGKGTHKGVARLGAIVRQVSQNGTRPCFALKCDIQKFFDSVDQGILLGILNRRVKDPDANWLLSQVVTSYKVERERERANSQFQKGVPIGNLTSQLFVNVYMNEFDQFVKHKLRVKLYLRYTDDFILVAENKEYLLKLVPAIERFLGDDLALKLHPQKVVIRTLNQGIDFLGYVVFLNHRQLRAKTKYRILKKLSKRWQNFEVGEISENDFGQSFQSYLGVLSHANTFKLSQNMKNQFWTSE